MGSKLMETYCIKMTKDIAQVAQLKVVTEPNDTDWGTIDRDMDVKLDWILYNAHPSSVTGRPCLPLATPRILEVCVTPLSNITNAIKEVA